MGTLVSAVKVLVVKTVTRKVAMEEAVAAKGLCCQSAIAYETENEIYEKKGFKGNQKFEFARVYCVIGGYSDGCYGDDRGWWCVKR